jgi:hypothetical protein
MSTTTDTPVIDTLTDYSKKDDYNTVSKSIKQVLDNFPGKHDSIKNGAKIGADWGEVMDKKIDQYRKAHVSGDKDVNGALSATKFYVNWNFCAILGALAGANYESNTKGLESVVKEDLDIYYNSIYAIAINTPPEGNVQKDKTAIDKIAEYKWFTYGDKTNIKLEWKNILVKAMVDNKMGLPPNLEDPGIRNVVGAGQQKSVVEPTSDFKMWPLITLLILVLIGVAYWAYRRHGLDQWGNKKVATVPGSSIQPPASAI